MAYKLNPFTKKLDYYQDSATTIADIEGMDGEAEVAPEVTPGSLGAVFWAKTDAGLLYSTSTSATNFVLNGGFETGDLTNWSAWGAPTTLEATTEKAYSGNYSCKLVTGVGGGGVLQNISGVVADPGYTVCHDIVLKVWITAGTTFGVYTNASDSGVLVSSPVDQWTTISVKNYPTTSSPYQLLFYISGAGTVYIDDVYYVPVPNIVSAWNDQSGGGNNLTITVAGRAMYWPVREVGAQNGYAAVSFDGVNDRLYKASGLTFTSPRSIYVVCNLLTGGIASSHDELLTDATGNGLYAQSTSLLWFDGYTAPVMDVTSYLNKYALFESVMNGPEYSYFYTNGALNKSRFYFTHFTFGPALYLGGVTRYTEAKWLEIAVFDKVLTTIQRTGLENYFNTKYALW